MKLLKGLWEKEIIRFLFCGGVNTLAGYIVMLIFGQFIITKGIDVFGISVSKDHIAILFEFLLCFPLSYTLQAKLAFRQKWELKRMFLYAFTIVPNLLLQWLMATILPETIPAIIRSAIIVAAPLPIMFIIIKLIVTPIKNLKKERT